MATLDVDKAPSRVAWMNIHQAAEYLGIDLLTLRVYRLRHGLPGYRIAARLNVLATLFTFATAVSMHNPIGVTARF